MKLTTKAIIIGAIIITIFVNSLVAVSEKAEIPILSEFLPYPGDVSVGFVQLFIWYLSDRSIGDPPIISLDWLPRFVNLGFYFLMGVFILLAVKGSQSARLTK